MKDLKRQEYISAAIIEHDKAKAEFFSGASLEKFLHAIDMIRESLCSQNKIMIFGNGGSAADAQHFAAEFVNRFMINRKALPVLSLTTDTSNLTSIANDRSYAEVFSRQIEAFGKAGDVVIGISTSGNSESITKALEVAKEMKIKTITLTGGSGGKAASIADITLNVSGTSITARIQEVHEMALHLICDLVEKEMFKGC